MRYMQEIKGNASPERVVVFDTETTGDNDIDPEFLGENKLRLGVACYVERTETGWSEPLWVEFKTGPEFHAWLDRFTHHKTPLYVVAHNMGFDSRVVDVFGEIARGRYLMSHPGKKKDAKGWTGYFVDDDPPFVLESKAASTMGVVRWVDTLNFWQTSLSRIGDDLGFPKLGQPMPMASDACWFPYCKRDVEICLMAFMKLVDFVADNDLGPFKNTRASLSMSAFRHRFMDVKPCLHFVPAVRLLERDSYYGGRLEMLFQGTHNAPVYALDVNSMYPALMADGWFPVTLVDYWNKTGRVRTPGRLSGRHIAEVEISSPIYRFPLRSRRAGTLYPTGDYWTTLAGPELQRAVDFGCIKRVGRWAEYRVDRIFRPFVEFFWKLRRRYKRNGNAADEQFCKFILNSLYGKFGQLSAEWETIGTDDMTGLFGQLDGIDFDSDLEVELRRIGPWTQRRTPRHEHTQSFPAVAAFVTAYGRELIRRAIEIAEESNVFYVVTDGIHMNRKGYLNLKRSGLVHPSQLGKFAVEDIAQQGTWEALHHYRLATKRKFGSRKISATTNPDGSVTETQFEGVRGVWCRTDPSRVQIRKIVKRYQKQYKRGLIGDDGRVVPLSLPAHREFAGIGPEEIGPRPRHQWRSPVEIEPSAEAWLESEGK